MAFAIAPVEKIRDSIWTAFWTITEQNLRQRNWSWDLINYTECQKIDTFGSGTGQAIGQNAAAWVS